MVDILPGFLVLLIRIVDLTLLHRFILSPVVGTDVMYFVNPQCVSEGFQSTLLCDWEVMKTEGRDTERPSCGNQHLPWKAICNHSLMRATYRAIAQNMIMNRCSLIE